MRYKVELVGYDVSDRRGIHLQQLLPLALSRPFIRQQRSASRPSLADGSPRFLRSRSVIAGKPQVSVGWPPSARPSARRELALRAGPPRYSNLFIALTSFTRCQGPPQFYGRNFASPVGLAFQRRPRKAVVPRSNSMYESANIAGRHLAEDKPRLMRTSMASSSL